MKKTACFSRAIFLSWYCSKRDCAFCHLSSRKVTGPEKDRRTTASILAEAIISKACGWDIEFLSMGCNTFNDNELLQLLKHVYRITGKRQWLNVGVLSKRQLSLFKPYIDGVCGTVECISPMLRKKLCPSKPLAPIIRMFSSCESLKLKRAITIIIGLGETIKDYGLLSRFIRKHSIDRIIFYRLKPQKGTVFEHSKGPETDYYVEWVRKTRKDFPGIEIIAGSWLTHLNEIHLLLDAGADSITKFPAIKKFGSKEAKKIEEEVKKAGRTFSGTLTNPPDIDLQELERLNIGNKLKNEIRKKLAQYLGMLCRIPEPEPD